MNESEETIFCEHRGCGKDKIILVHGLGASRKSFYDIVPYLEPYYELFLIDLVGFGDSNTPDNWTFSLENQSIALYNFLKRNNLSGANIVGHSYGGIVTLMLLLELERRNEADTINKVILIDTTAYMQKYPFFIYIPKTPILRFFLMTLVSARIQAITTLKYLFYDDKKITEERIERYATYYRKKSHKEAIIESSKRMIPDNYNRIEEELRNIETNILILYGDNDPVIPRKNIMRLNNELSNSELIILKEAGHVIHEEKPFEVAQCFKTFLGGKSR
ncbi:MAG: alpha/beta hydrolase [Proteobacteria bacterium]|nr:alpha/beta hydrolase [Pseudomonadota bacterium]